MSLFPFAIACGGELNAPSGTISSPNYPNLYPHSRVCRWEIVVPAGRRVTLTINDLRLEDTAACSFDYVEVNCPPTNFLFFITIFFIGYDLCFVVLHIVICHSINQN